MAFRVRWIDAAGPQLHETLTEAGSAEAAVQRTVGPGAIVLSVERVRAPLRANRGSQFDVAWWCRELRTLLAAGMTVVEAMDTLQAQQAPEGRRHVQAELVAQLQQGRSLSEAMQSTGAFSLVLLAGVKGSERTGAVVEALDDFLRYHELLERLRKQVVSAAIYPAIVVTLGALIAVFLLLFVIPRFSRMYGDMQGPVSLPTQVLMAGSRFLGDHGALVALAFAAMAVALVGAWRSGALRAFCLRTIESVPPLARRADEFRLAKLYQALAVMFRGGYALDDALGQCETLGLGAGMAARIRTARLALVRGQQVSTAWANAGLADGTSQRLLAVGERTGAFERVLATIAERHAANFTTFIERATRIVEPVLLLLVALLVGGIVVAMYMPVFDIASSLR